MAKAGGEHTTTWIRYSEAKALVGEYLGDATEAERDIRKGLEAAQIPWQCVRFDAPEGYSGPGAGDANFWREPDNLGLRLEWLAIKGDSARHINGAVALGIDLDRSALVEQGLLQPDAVDDDDTLAKVWAPRVAQELKRAHKLDQVTKKIELAKLIVAARVAAGHDRVGVDYIRDHLDHPWGIWPVAKIKV